MPDLHERWRTSIIEATTYEWAVERNGALVYFSARRAGSFTSSAAQ